MGFLNFESIELFDILKIILVFTPVFKFTLKMVKLMKNVKLVIVMGPREFDFF